MALPDISQLNSAELQELAQNVQLRYAQSLANDEATEASRKQAIGAAIVNLQNLLGDPTAPANTNSIHGVQKFTDAQIAASPVLAFRLIFQGMQQIVETQLNIAKVLAKK